MILFLIIISGTSIAYRDASARFGLTSESVFLDQLNCNGEESAILNCHYSRPLGLAECDTSDVAGVQCKGRSILSCIMFNNNIMVSKPSNMHIYIYIYIYNFQSLRIIILLY